MSALMKIGVFDAASERVGAKLRAAQEKKDAAAAKKAKAKEDADRATYEALRARFGDKK